jgi:hypothetical protein
MANDKRFIVKNGLRADNVEFTDSQDGSNQITLNMLNTDTLNFEGDAGSLFSISDDLTGTVFSVGDISGIPIIEANGDTHNVTFNEFDGKVMIGGTDSGSTDSDVLNVTGNVRATAYYGDGSNLSGISASGGTDSATVSAIITADVDKAFVDALNVDADTLDGVNSTSFLRSDAADAFSGKIDATGTIEFAGGTTFDPSGGGTGTDTATDVGIALTSGNRIVGTHNGYIRTLVEFSGNAEPLNIGQSSTSIINHTRIYGGSNGVELYENTTKRLETTSTGVTVTGTMSATTFSGSGASLTTLNASNLSSGTVSDARLPASISSDITGNAATATALATGRNIDVTGVTATAASFDGTGDIDIEVTAVPSSLLTGTIDSARLPVIASANDAGTLDGINSTSFLRSDAADTKTSGNLVFNDDVYAQFGTSGDLNIFHNASNSFIRDVGTGALFLDTNGTGITLRKDASENMAKFLTDGAVELYYDNSKKFETTSTGATVTGTAKATTKFETDDVTIGFTSNGATSGSGNFGVASSTGGARINATSGSDAATFIDFDATEISATGGDVTYRFGRNTTEGTSDLSSLIMYAHDGANTPVFTVTSNGDLTLASTDDGATENPTLDLYRNSASPADNDILGHIHFSGENDADQKVVYNEIESRLLDASDGTEDGRLVINTMTDGSLITHYSTGFGFNQFHREVLLASGINLQFEGATSDGVRTTLTVTDPTSARTITFPDATGTVALTSDITGGGLDSAEVLTVVGTGSLTGVGGGFAVNGLLSATTKSFDIEHPTKEGKRLRYGSLEGPENGVYVRGRLKGDNRIQLPDYWTGLVDEDTITVNLTPIGSQQSLFVEDIADNQILIGGCRKHVDAWDINCFYTVYGERKDVDQLVVEYDA